MYIYTVCVHIHTHQALCSNNGLTLHTEEVKGIHPRAGSALDARRRVQCGAGSTSEL